jgi:dipeptidyl aminopeptidase/acylaminoacyl peptidase
MTVRARLLIAVAAIAALAMSVGPAQSAFPGANGKIVFASDRDGVGNQNIYVMAADGTGQTALTNAAGEDQYPVWSADGNRIVFSSAREGNDKLFTMNADGSAQTRRTDSTLFHDVEPSWSRDGTKIAFRSDRENGLEVWTMNADGTGLTRITDDPDFLNVNPMWSPVSDQIVFAGSGGGDFEIIVMNGEGTGLQPLTSNTAFDSNPDWSPDGSKIAFQSDRDGDFDVYVMNADGTGVVQLTNDPEFDSAPTWSPDGTKLAFQSRRDGDFEIFVMNADGSGQTQLTTNTATDRVADWQPQPTGGDVTPPVLALPADQTIPATGPGGAVFNYIASATDNTDPSPTVGCAPPSGSTFPIGSTTVACTATDASGNTSNGSFRVTVSGAREQLGQFVQELVAASALPPAVRAALLAIVQNFNPGNPAHVRAACGGLRLAALLLRFSSDPRAPGWIADSNRIRAVLGC